MCTFLYLSFYLSSIYNIERDDIQPFFFIPFGKIKVVIFFLITWQAKELMNAQKGGKKRCLRRTQTGPW